MDSWNPESRLGPPRTVGDCSTFAGALPPLLSLNTPLEIAGSYSVSGANFNPDPPISVTADIELVDDEDDEGARAGHT